MSVQIEDCARQLLEAGRSRETYKRLEGSLDEAYAVQARYVQLAQSDYAAGPVTGFKIALTSRTMQTLVGVDEPLYGCVFADRVQPTGGVVILADHQHLGVEFEVAVELGRDLAPGASPHTRSSVASAVSGVAPAFELVEDRNADYTQINAFSVVAENAWNAGVIVGTYRDQTLDAEVATRLWVDGEPSGEGRVGDALGHPLEAVAWLANQLNGRGKVLREGTFVMTGSSIRTTFPEPGQHYRFEVEGLGTVETSFE